MTNAAFFLITRNIKNRLVRSIGRLRQPRYVLGAIAAGAYFWTFLIRKNMRAAATFGSATYVDMMSIIVAAIALVILIAAWALPATGPGLVFSEAEIQFFFAGPVSRRQLLAYKILRSQLQSLFSAVVFTFFAFRGSHFVGLWIALASLDVYLTFASFARVRLKQIGIGWIVRLVLISILLTVAASMIRPQLHASSDLIANALHDRHKGSLVRAMATILAAPPLSTMLYVPRFFAAAVYGSSPIVPCLAIVVISFLLFFLTTQLDVAFEDSSIIASQRALTRRARMRSMRSGASSAPVNRLPAPFKLAEQGRPEVAMIWKNLIGAMRISAFPIIALAIPLAVFAIGNIFRNKGVFPDVIGVWGLMSTAMFMFFGPRAVRTDLRTDILRLDVIKTYPLSAESLLIGELGASLIVVSIAELLMLLSSVWVLQYASPKFAFFTTPEFVVSALVFVIPISAIQLLIQNGAVILFPAWNTSTDNNRFSAMGQRLLMFAGNAVMLTIALVPAAIFFVPSVILVQKVMHGAPVGILMATILPAGVLVAEIYVALKFLAAQFEDIDIANDLDIT